MTTAHRPTWAPAKGGEEQGGMRFFAPSKMQSVKDLPGQTTLKFRQDGQGSVAELRRKDLMSELQEKERKHFLKTKPSQFEEERDEDLRLLEAGGDSGGPRLIPKALDADDEDDEDEESDDSEDDEDEEAELLAELERIKKERAEDAAEKAATAAAAAEQQQQAELLRGNPLLEERLAGGGAGAAGGADASFTLKRRWDDDVVFRNQARSEPKQQRRFINDTIRNDFHRRFLDRYMK